MLQKGLITVQRFLRRILPVLIITCGISSSLFAQTGSIEGFVIDKKTNETLIGTGILIDGTTKGAVTNVDGQYQITNINPGKHFIKISYVGYYPILIENIIVEANKTTQQNILMDASDVSIDEVVVSGKRRTNTDEMMISSIKSSPLLVSSISGQQIQRSQDKDASEVVRRVPGITIIDDRFIIVRGLNQRYNNVWLNNAATPSSETDVKSFSFDVIPSGLIENIMIYKSAAPEFPAEFTGGFIKITTKNMPVENFTNIDYSSSYRTSSTFKDFYSYKGGKMDWLGFDDGTRALPKGFPSDLKLVTDPSTINDLSKAFNKNLTATSSTARPDQKFGITLGRKIKFKNAMLGNTSSLSYSNSLDYNPINNNSFTSYNILDDLPSYRFKYEDNQYTNNVKFNLLHSWALYINRNNKIEFRNLFNQSSFTRTTLRDGYDYYSSIAIRSYEHRFMSRSTYSGQLSGEHTSIEGISKLDWNVGYAYANRLEPDRKVLTTKLNENTGNYELALPNTANPRLAGRLYLDNHEHIFSNGVNYERYFDFGHLPPMLKFGYYLEYKNRKFNARNIGYANGSNFYPTSDFLSLPFDQIFKDENFDYSNGLKITESTNKSDSYKSDNTLIAGYMGLNMPFTLKLNLYFGVRAEQNRMTLSSFEPGVSTPVKVDNNRFNLFPSANISYKINDKNVIRFACGRSINRPEFREIAPFVFYDFNDVAGYSGNPGLKDATIQNFDLRFENYPSSTETFSLALFYKSFYNPIEMVYVDAGSGLQYSFNNANGAKSMGVELDIRRSLEFISILKNFSVVLNGSLINSKVIFPSNTTEKNRPLYGQSPYIANAGIFYQNPSNGLAVSILYNIMGKRIIVVGQLAQNPQDNIPDLYEMPHNLIDITITKKIGKHFELKGGIKDLLNEKYRYQQSFSFFKTSENAQVTRNLNTKEFQKGTIFSLGLSYKF
ncbi:MAG: TonB-dependent receptor [Bacteroidales bacterium]|nr:TonB-dependent receptor [Bacteroidales bacterium]